MPTEHRTAAKVGMHAEPLDPATSNLEALFPGYRKLRIALAHYWFTSWRGGEKVVKTMLDLFPLADIYTLFHDPDSSGNQLSGHRIFSSRLDSAWLRRRYRSLFPLYPSGVRSLKLMENYDLLISSESGPIKGIARGNIPHIAYVHTPMRYCWEDNRVYLEALPAPLRPLGRRAFERLRRYDETTIGNVNRFIANSEHVRSRIAAFYHQEARVIYPPIDDEILEDEGYLERTPNSGSYFISFGAITPYKRIDLLVEAFNRNGKRLIIVGEGSERSRLAAAARSNITFTGYLSWKDVRTLLLGAKALLFPGIEDFGMVPLEAMALGLPVIAYGAGGARETVIEIPDKPEASTGLFFSQHSAESIAEAVDRFESVASSFNPALLHSYAGKFSRARFQRELLCEISDLLR